jgi:hypothetical protein
VGGGSRQFLPMVLAIVPRTLLSVRRVESVGRSAEAFPSESTPVGLVGVWKCMMVIGFVRGIARLLSARLPLGWSSAPSRRENF